MRERFEHFPRKAMDAQLRLLSGGLYTIHMQPTWSWPSRMDGLRNHTASDLRFPILHSALNFAGSRLLYASKLMSMQFMYQPNACGVASARPQGSVAVSYRSPSKHLLPHLFKHSNRYRSDNRNNIQAIFHICLSLHYLRISDPVTVLHDKLL